MISVAALFISSSLRERWPEHPLSSIAEKSAAVHVAYNIRGEMPVLGAMLQPELAGKEGQRVQVK
ncbi:MAG TPA: hypothetical protein VFR24_16010 [Candidatus Angelobacter sp.]|nr:hypothetical protein [Candidatus Angelobacter sp.]